MDKQLLPCPFCANENLEIHEGVNPVPTNLIRCNKCFTYQSSSACSQEDAIQKWNTRIKPETESS
jgi:hypothetical protein